MAQQPTGVRLPRIEHPDDHPLMTVRKVAELLGCSDMTIRRRIAVRQFPAVRIGRKSMVPRSFVESLLAQAEAGQTVVVDEAVGEWAAAHTPTPDTQMRPDGIAARRGSASQAPAKDRWMPVHGTDDRGSAPVGPLLGFAAFLLAGSLVMRLPFGLLMVAAVAVTIAVTVVVGAVRRERRANAVWDADYEASQRFEAVAWRYTAWDPDEFWSAG